jgi:mannosyltransferase
MPSQHRLVLDSIIFGLQRYGGISNYWARLLDAAAACSVLAPCLVLPQRLKYADIDTTLLHRMPAHHERLPASVTRYLRSAVPQPQATFHTSYYRLPHGRVARYVVSAYDFTYERYRRGLARRVHTTQKIASLRRADAVLCISNATKQDVLEFCPDIDESKLWVTHLGVDLGTFKPDPVPQSDNETTVLFVGQRAGYKRFDLAVDALRQCPRLKLGVVGPPLTDAERELLHATLGERWHEFGPVSTAELRRLYSTAFAFIFPSDYEGFGLPILEAMACGCPVIAANLSSLPEVGAHAARYAAEQRGDAYAELLDALTNQTMRDLVVQTGVARAAEFSWAKTFEQTLAVYLDTPRTSFRVTGRDQA